MYSNLFLYSTASAFAGLFLDVFTSLIWPWEVFLSLISSCRDLVPNCVFDNRVRYLVLGKNLKQTYGIFQPSFHIACTISFFLFCQKNLFCIFPLLVAVSKLCLICGNCCCTLSRVMYRGEYCFQRDSHSGSHIISFINLFGF